MEFDKNDIKIRSRGKLPHFEKDEGIYFVTFRLSGSLPRNIIARIIHERKTDSYKSGNFGASLAKEVKGFSAKLLLDECDKYLDLNEGVCYLKIPEVANLVEGAIRFFDNKKYQLISWVIMPNHVHVVIKSFKGSSLPMILHSWKSYTATGANKLLNRQGRFWAKEYYDHLIRSDEELINIVKYVLNNPPKAGLTDWKWVGVIDDFNEIIV